MSRRTHYTRLWHQCQDLYHVFCLFECDITTPILGPPTYSIHTRTYVSMNKIECLANVGANDGFQAIWNYSEGSVPLPSSILYCGIVSHIVLRTDSVHMGCACSVLVMIADDVINICCDACSNKIERSEFLILFVTSHNLLLMLMLSVFISCMTAQFCFWFHKNSEKINKYHQMREINLKWNLNGSDPTIDFPYSSHIITSKQIFSHNNWAVCFYSRLMCRDHQWIYGKIKIKYETTIPWYFRALKSFRMINFGWTLSFRCQFFDQNLLEDVRNCGIPMSDWTMNMTKYIPINLSHQLTNEKCS